MAWGDAAACCIREAKPHGRPFWSIQSEHRHHWPRARPTQAATVCCSCRRCLSSANARLRLQLRRAFCGSELMAPQLCRMRLRCAAASPQMPLLPLGYRAASTLGMACCSVQSQPAFALQGRDTQACAGDERAQPAIAGCTRSATEKRQRTLRVAPDLCDLQGPSPRGKTALFTPLFAECLSATTGYWNTMKMVQSPCMSLALSQSLESKPCRHWLSLA